MQFAVQPPGSTGNVTASGPSSAAVYAPATITCNFTPGFGSCANVNSGIWQADGTNALSNTTCVQVQGSTTQSIIYDLGSTKTINRLYVTMHNDGNYALAQVSFSNDNLTYTSSTSVYATQYSNAIKYFNPTLSPNVTARYVRLMNGGGYSNSSGGAMCNLAVGP